MARKRKFITGGRVWGDGLWFRVLGYGLHVKLRAGHVPLFSERYGYSKAYYIGPLRFELLRPAA